MENKDIHKKVDVINTKLKEMVRLERLLVTIKRYAEQDQLVPDAQYTVNIEKRINTLKSQFDKLLK